MKNILFVLTLLTFTFPAYAERQGFAGTPTKLITDTISYGWCMAQFPTMQITLDGCNSTYISFACSGDTAGISKAQAAVNWSQIQLAMVTGAPTYVVVDGNQKYNGQYCVGNTVFVDAVP